jgi:hypothetical protein
MTLLEYIQQRIEQNKQHNNIIRFPIEKRINDIEEQKHGYESKEKKSTSEGHKTR